jgi:C1A family cysteine protease
MSTVLFERRGLGWKKDRPKTIGEKADRLAKPKLGIASPPPTGSIEPYILSILDQGRLGSCTIHAVSQAIRASHARQGIKNPTLLSRLWGYYLARAYDHDTANDDGTYLRNIYQALVKFGFPPETIWPYSDDTSSPKSPFRVMPPPEAFREAIDQKDDLKITEYLRIDSTGYERIDDIKRAIGAGYGVNFGTQVSNDFCSNILGSKPLDPPTPASTAGGHALLAAAFDKDSNFRIPNSYGKDWGDEGWVTFSADYLMWSNTDDLWIVETAPVFTQDATS